MASAHNDTRETVSMDERIMDITTENGIPFRVVYGYRKYRNGKYSVVPDVAFYDRRYADYSHGRLIADCDREYLLQHHRSGFALNLSGGNPEGIIDPAAMYVIMTWLNYITWQEEN